MKKFSFTQILVLLLIGIFAEAAPFKGHQIAMSAANRYATQAGQKIAELGGNPVDIAVTMALTMSVTNPSFAALGGGGFSILKINGELAVLDFRERAPAEAKADYFLSKSKNSSITGGAAVGVPGLPYGLWEMHRKFGKISWKKLFSTAIELAENGYRISGRQSEDIVDHQARLNAAAKRYLMKPDGKAYLPGEIVRQKNLGRALRLLRDQNVGAFYSGPIAKDIVSSVSQSGGSISLKDLSDYKPVWRKPLELTHAGHKLYLMPPPSSGGIVIATALQLIDRLKLKQYPLYSADEFHMLGQVLSRAFRGRTRIADPDHSKIPQKELLSENYIEGLAKSISLSKATELATLTDTELEYKESSETTHLSVLDKNGNAVAMTFTLNGNLGSGVATEKFGIVLNNEMDDFTTRPGEPNMFGLIQGKENAVAPGKRPLSSMSPTLVEKDGKIILAVGAPGGPRIISSVLQTIYRILDRGLSIEAAVEAPRVHHQTLPNIVFVDENRFSPEIVKELERRKNKVEVGWQALVYAVHNVDGILEAVADPRSEGSTSGF